MKNKIVLLLTTVLLVQAFLPLDSAYAYEDIDSSTTEICSEDSISEDITDIPEDSTIEPARTEEFIYESKNASEMDDVANNSALDADPADDTDWAQYFVINGGIITGLQNGGYSLSKIVIPDSLGITEIASCAFGNGNPAYNQHKVSQATEITLPSTLVKIDGDAFRNCAKLTRITIPASVKIIGGGAFYGCSSLAELELKSGNISCGHGIFTGCAINKVVFPTGIKTIPEFMFQQATFNNCDLVIPNSVETIEHAAFIQTPGIKSITFEKDSKLTKIGTRAFKGYPLATIEFPDSLRIIEADAFEDGNLESITLPNNLEYVMEAAFVNNKNLRELTILSNKIKVNGSNGRAFAGCAISKLNIPEGITYVPEALFNKATFKNCDIVIPSTVQEIRARAFSEAKNISSVSFASGSKLKTIGDAAFSGSELFTIIELPEGLTTIGKEAFRSSKLLKITIPSSVKKIGDGAFQNISAAVSFRVVNGSYAYKWLRSNGFDNNIVTVYSIIYKLNNGVNSVSNPSAYLTGETVDLAAPSRVGYDFSGWFKDSKYKTSVSGITSEDTGNKTFYAKWTEIQYSIIYNGADISTIKNPPISYTIQKAVTLKSPKRLGYKFSYWADETGVKTTKIKKGSTGNKVFNAVWTPVSYKISYNLKGGKLPADAIKKYDIEAAFQLPIPQKNGYNFDGWYDNSKYMGEAIDNIEPGSTGNKKFFAKWTKQ